MIPTKLFWWFNKIIFCIQKNFRSLSKISHFSREAQWFESLWYKLWRRRFFFFFSKKTYIKCLYRIDKLMALSFEQEFDIADCVGRTLQLPVEVTLDDRTQRKERSTTMSHLKRSFANESFVTIRAEIAPRIARVQQVKEHYDITQREPADETRERPRRKNHDC